MLKPYKIESDYRGFAQKATKRRYETGRGSNRVILTRFTRLLPQAVPYQVNEFWAKPIAVEDALRAVSEST
jgi:hypothetical protein